MDANSKVVKFQGKEYRCKKGVEVHGRAVRVEFSWRGQVQKPKLCTIKDGDDVQRVLDQAGERYGTIRQMLDSQSFSDQLYAALLPESDFAKKLGKMDANVTFKDCAKDYLDAQESKIARGLIARGTINRRRAMLSNLDYTGPIKVAKDKRLREFGLNGMPIGMIQLRILTDLQDYLQFTKGLSQSTVNNVIDAIKQVFKHAQLVMHVIEEDAARNVRTLKRPRKSAEDHLFFTPEMQEIVYKSIVDDGKPWLAEMFEFGCWTGLRKQELIGVAWEDVDMEEGVLEVRRAHPRKGWREVKAGGERMIALPGPAIEALQRMRRWTEHLPRQTYEVMREDHGGGLNEQVRLIFMNFAKGAKGGANGARAWNDTSTRKAWERVRARSGISIPLMFSRHSYATVAVAAGVAGDAIARELGHSDTRMLQRTYGDARHIVDREAAKRRDEMLIAGRERMRKRSPQ